MFTIDLKFNEESVKVPGLKVKKQEVFLSYFGDGTYLSKCLITKHIGPEDISCRVVSTINSNLQKLGGPESFSITSDDGRIYKFQHQQLKAENIRTFSYEIINKISYDFAAQIIFTPC